MKRTPLKPGKPLVSRSVLRCVTPIKQRSPQRVKDGPVRAAAESALGREGTTGTCARCGTYGYVNGHERTRRSQGGDPTRPDCLLCLCCNTWAASGDLARAAWQGWLITPKYPRDPMLGPSQARTIDGRIHTFPERTT